MMIVPLPLLPYIGLAVDSDTSEIMRMRMRKCDDSCGQVESEIMRNVKFMLYIDFI